MIGVLAATHERARTVIAELQLEDAQPVGLTPGKGRVLDGLVIDETALPVPEKVRAAVWPTLTCRPDAISRVYLVRQVALGEV